MKRKTAIKLLASVPGAEYLDAVAILDKYRKRYPTESNDTLIFGILGNITDLTLEAGESAEFRRPICDVAYVAIVGKAKCRRLRKAGLLEAMKKRFHDYYEDINYGNPKN